jgi:prevent-host-death family protein
MISPGRYACSFGLDIDKLVYYTSIMKTKSKSIGSFDAKTHLSRILEEIQGGAEYIITKRGRPIARLVQYKDKDDSMSLDDVILRLGKIRDSVKGKVNIQEYISEGRRH